MKKIEHDILKRVELYDSSNESIAIIKVADPKTDFNEIERELERIYGGNIIDGSGVYFISMKGDFYIGEAKNLKKRTFQHLKDKEISHITYATSKSKRNSLNKDDIKDIESLLLSYAQDYGFDLTNIKNESTNSMNESNLMTNSDKAQWVWKGILSLNIEDILENVSNNKAALETNSSNKHVISFTNVSTRDMDFDLSNVTTKANVLNNIPGDLEIFKSTIRRDDVAKAYRSSNIEIFNKKYAVDVIMDYVYRGMGNAKIDSKYTKGKRNRGWVTAATMAFYKIETNGKAKLTLASLPEETAIDLIKEMVG